MSATSVAAEELVGRRRRQPIAVEGDAARASPSAAARHSSTVSTASKRCSLSSWRSLLYVSGSPCRTPWRATRWAATRGALARSSSAASGFFFCGMMLEPLAKASDDLAEAELLARPDDDLGPELREVRRAQRGRGEVVDHEVAVGHGVDRVRGHAGKPELARDAAPVRLEVDARQGPGAQWKLVGRGEAEPEALAVTAKLPEVGEQVVREVHGLRPLEVRVPGHGPVEMPLGEVDQRPASGASTAASASRAPARTKSARSVATWSLRDRAVWSLPANRPDDLGEPALDRHVDVLVVRARPRRSRTRSRPAPAPGRRTSVGPVVVAR